MDGLLLIDKPLGTTSFDVVKRVREVANISGVGHTGTLDPQASGLLPIVVGKCTKLARFLSLEMKAYDFEMQLGVETETGDVEGEVVRESRWEHVTRGDLVGAADAFIGKIEQVPPLYSAVKIDGRRAYELAREGVDFELEARPVFVDCLEVTDFDPPRVRLHTRCGSGTYVRALVRDLAGAVGSCAYTTAIRRTAVGEFDVEEAVSLDRLDSESVQSSMLPPLELMRGLPMYDAAPSEATALGYGQRIPIVDVDVELKDVVAVADRDDELVAVTRVVEGRYGLQLKPERVLKAE